MLTDFTLCGKLWSDNMILQGKRVVTEQGTGTIITVEEDFTTLETSAVVRLDKEYCKYFKA